jgi:hypothetical protein
LFLIYLRLNLDCIIRNLLFILFIFSIGINVNWFLFDYKLFMFNFWYFWLFLLFFLFFSPFKCDHFSFLRLFNMLLNLIIMLFDFLLKKFLQHDLWSNNFGLNVDIRRLRRISRKHLNIKFRFLIWLYF